MYLVIKYLKIIFILPYEEIRGTWQELPLQLLLTYEFLFGVYSQNFPIPLHMYIFWNFRNLGDNNYQKMSN